MIERNGIRWVYLGVSEGANWFAVEAGTLLACPADRDGSLPADPWGDCCEVDKFTFEKLERTYEELYAHVVDATREPDPQDCEEESTP